MLLQGLTITVVGMSVVFIFLTLLVFGMKLLSIVVPRFFKDSITVVSGRDRISESTKKIPMGTTQPSIGDAEIAAAIAAVSVYTRK